MKYLIYGEDAIRLAKRDNLTLLKQNEEFGYYEAAPENEIKKSDSVAVHVQPAGWVAPQGTDLRGYCYGDYFDRNGEYKGPDEFGIEIKFVDV